MKTIKLLILIITLLTLSSANTLANVDKQESRQIVLTEQLSYNLITKQVVNTFKKYQIYLAISRKNTKQAYYYGCDGYGRQKVYITITRKDNLLNALVQVTVEGDLPQKEAEESAINLINGFIASLENKEEK